MGTRMSRIFDIFSGDFVVLTLTKNRRQSIEHGGGLKVIEQPTEISGYLIEEDDTYFYLGSDPGVPQIAVNRTQVSTLEIGDPNASDEELMNEILADFPEDKGGMN